MSGLHIIERQIRDMVDGLSLEALHKEDTRRKLIDLARSMRLERLETKQEIFARQGCKLVWKRFKYHGGVGTCYWMPRLKKWRIQVHAAEGGHTATCYRYAWVVEV